MPDIEDGGSVEVKGSAAEPYVLRNTGGVYSCSCPAWRNQSSPQERRTCKHLRALRGDDAERGRLGGEIPAGGRPRASKAGGGEDVAGPPILLAHPWDGQADLTGWWMSEKLDGVRAYWDGQAFLSRLGNRYAAPDWFVAGLPSIPLDGELWGGRKRFQRTVSIVRRQGRPREWEQIAFVVFDAPAHGGSFEDRLALCRELLGDGRAPHARVHEHEVCRSLDHLRTELARVEAEGGEGLMLRRPGSSYEVGRSASLLKVKSFQDAEARVLEHLPGAGKHAGTVGALLVEMADGTRVSVGTGLSVAERRNPPPIGTTITFRFQELSEGGVPRFPSYVGVRHDVELSPLPAVVPVVTPAVAIMPAASEPPPATPAALGPPPAPSTASPSAPAAASGARRFEFSEGASNKFWEITLAGNSHTVRFGRVGTAGQEKTKTFPDEAAATRDAEKLVAEKTRKGYVPVGGESG